MGRGLRIKEFKNLNNSIWNVLEVLLTPLIFFLSIPVFLNLLGLEKYGLWMLVNSIVVVMQAFNLGLSFSTYRNVAEAIKRDDTQRIFSTINTNLTLNLLIFAVAALVGLVLSAGIYEYDWFIEGSIKRTELIISVLIGVLILFLKLTEQIVFNVFRAFEVFKYVTIIAVSVKIFVVLTNIGIAYFYQSIPLILVSTAFFTLAGILTSFYFLKQFLPSYRFTFSWNERLIRKEIDYALLIWLQNVAVICVYQGDRLVVSYLFGLSALSYYAIVSTLFNHIHMALSSLTSWVFPRTIKRKGSEEDAQRFYVKVRNLSIVASVFLLSVFSMISEPLLSLWLGIDRFASLQSILRGFLIFEFFFIFTIVPNHFLNGSSRELFQLKNVGMYTFFNALGIGLGALLFDSVEAMVYGLALTSVFGMLFYHFKINRSLKYLQVGEGNLLKLFIPSLLGSMIVYADTYLLKLGLFMAVLISIYFVYIKGNRSDYKILLQ